MTVGDLIKLLGQQDKSLRVMVYGYEGGYDEVIAAKSISLRFDINEPEYLGRHDDAGGDPSAVKALLLTSNRRT